MGMPTPYFQPQNPVQNIPAIHSNATMGMPLPPQNGPFSQPTESMPMMQSNGAMGMGYAQFPMPFPQQQIYHSNSTMAMPTMTEAEARARLLAGQSQVMPGFPDPYAAMRAAMAQPDPSNARPSKKNSKKSVKDEEEGDEVNLLAVIVFGSLSVTALGGLGMLILLWFTSM
jgi:hypothetical protein